MNTMRIYIPKQCLALSSGLLLGYMDEAQTFCCITGFSDRSKKSCSLLTTNLPDNRVFGIVAILEKNNPTSCPNNLQKYHNLRQPSLRIIYEDGQFLVHHYSGSELQTHDEANNFVVLVYDAEQFSGSVFMEVSADKPSCDDLSNVGLLKQSFYLQREYLESEIKGQKVSVKDFSRQIPSRAAAITGLCYNVIFYITSLVLNAVTVVHSRVPKFAVLKSLMSRPATCCHVQQKFNMMSARVCSASISSRHQLSFVSYIWLHLLDVFIGITLMVWLLHDNRVSDIAHHLIASAENVASELDRLLVWLMGVPAGLKLNQPLAHFLGKFFSYHIFLWKAYLNAIKHVSGAVLSSASFTGCLGVTVQLAVIQDILSMMTFHIYCFYVYAARLYNLQVHALSSLWRLFRGKKWNVLRKRVDSAGYDIDQLFLGTLLFTILLFLLPTTALFYAVFAMLRIVVLSIQGILFKLVSFVSHLPLYWLLLRLFRCTEILGDVHISVTQCTPLCLKLDLKPVSVKHLFEADAACLPAAGSSGVLPPHDNTWRTLLHKLIFGERIYPWIQSEATRTTS